MKYKSLILLLPVLLFLFQSCKDNSVSDSDPDNNGDPSFSFNHERNPGASAEDFLQDAEFENLIVEVDYMEGYEPTDDALNSLESFLEERLNKNSVTIMSPTSIPAGGQDSYTASEVRDLEGDHRDEFSEENTIAAYLIILDGEYDQNNVLGIAYYNTSMAFFGETIRNVSGDIGQNPRDIVEATVMRHEFGHILGLVNNGVEMQQNHQDDEHGAHCDNDNCLMYYSVRTTDFFAALLGGDVPPLDEQCRTDLQAAGGK